MRHGTIVYRNTDGTPCSSKDFAVDDKAREAEAKYEPSDDVVAWLLGEYMAYRRSVLESEATCEGGE